jgi:hypothetical protein
VGRGERPHGPVRRTGHPVDAETGTEAGDVIEVARGLLVVMGLAEFLGLMVFVGLYARSQWRSTAAGRTLMAYPWALIVVIIVTTIARVWPSPATVWATTGAHVMFAFVVWHRVFVLRRYQRRQERDDVEGP